MQNLHFCFFMNSQTSLARQKARSFDPSSLDITVSIARGVFNRLGDQREIGEEVCEFVFGQAVEVRPEFRALDRIGRAAAGTRLRRVRFGLRTRRAIPTEDLLRRIVGFQDEIAEIAEGAEEKGPDQRFKR